jgi:UDPglucose 6-dehydrogenase
MNIGIIGMGFVGTAVFAGFDNIGNNVVTADPKHGTTVQEVLEAEPEVIFVCVPTPMGDDGVADTSIVESVFEQLKNYRGIPVLKSTVIPSVIERLQKLHPRFVYNPEFLTEARAVYDFLNPKFHVFGGNYDDCVFLAEIYDEDSNCLSVHSSNIHFVTPKEAALIKYGVNSFLAAKVMFMNQWADLCLSVGADYENVAAGMGSDPRITKSHMMVPGHDGRRGTAGACFAKDIPAIIRESMSLDSELSILREAWNKNCDIRNSYGEPLPREVEQHISFNKI